MHDSDRRRLLLAAVITLIALPAIFLYSRADSDAADDGAPAATAVDGVINPLPDVVADEPAATVVPTSNESQLPPTEAPDGAPIFMDGPVVDEAAEAADVAVPAQPAIAPLRLDATFLSTVPGTRSCLIKGVDSGRTVSVVNLDNGRSITCVTVIAPATQRDDLVMHTRSFEQLADLTEAPIAVEVRQ